MANTTNNAATDKVIGRGVSFPLVFGSSRNTELLELASGPDVINQSIHMIIFTRLGERYNSNEFGCNIWNLIFEPNDLILKDLLYYSIYDALDRWEKRISIINIDFASSEYGTNPDPTSPIDDHTIVITVKYLINSTHKVGSYVFPFVKGAMPYSEVITGTRSFNSSTLTQKQ